MLFFFSKLLASILVTQFFLKSCLVCVFLFLFYSLYLLSYWCLVLNVII